MFRLCRIVYFNRSRLNSFWIYAVAAPCQICLGFPLMGPLLLWNSEQYLPDENHCFLSIVDYNSLVWSSCSVYSIPIICLFMIYVRITIYLRRQTNHNRLLIKRRRNRDLIAIRSIFIIITLLLMTGIPSIVLIIYVLITGEQHRLTYRIIWFFLALPMLALSIGLVCTTPELKRTVFPRAHQNQVTPIQPPIDTTNRSRTLKY